MIKVIIFDVDGVLWHVERFSDVLEREYGITKEQTLPFFNGIFQECRIGNADLRTELIPFLEKWGWSRGVDAFLDSWFGLEVKLNHDLIDYIKVLKDKGMICVIGTNQEKYRFKHILEKVVVTGVFEKAYASADIGYSKPNHKFFEKIVSDHPDIQKDRFLLVDDRRENVESARDFGINAEFYESFEDFKEKIQKYL